jgi:hypothetical protein
MLVDLRMQEEEKIEQLKREILEKFKKGEDHEELYSSMLKSRK